MHSPPWSYHRHQATSPQVDSNFSKLALTYDYARPGIMPNIMMSAIRRHTKLTQPTPFAVLGLTPTSSDLLQA